MCTPHVTLLTLQVPKYPRAPPCDITCRNVNAHVHGFSARAGCIVLELDIVHFPHQNHDLGDNNGSVEAVPLDPVPLDPGSWLDLMNVHHLLESEPSTAAAVSVKVQ